MDLESATRELYGMDPTRFTAARNAKAADARQAGHPDIASSLKKLRKPSVGAWLANLLVLEQAKDVQRLVDLGVDLRGPRGKLEGEQIRRVSKEKGDTVSKLVRDARARAARAGLPVSAAAVQELEETLEAAFADPQAADRLLGGRLSSGLHYSGLGLGEQAGTGSPTGIKGSASARRSRSEASRISAERNFEKASREAEQAAARVEKARRAVMEATQELTRLKSAEALAARRSKEAHARASAAKKKLSTQRETG